MRTEGHEGVELTALRAWEADFPLDTPLRHASVDTSTLQSVIVQVETATGSVGTAEVRANGGYATGEGAEHIRASLGRLRLPTTITAATEQLLRSSKLAAMAVDVAAWDAHARLAGTPLSHVWADEDVTVPLAIRTHAQIGFADGPEQAAHAVASGYDRLKVRLGGGDVEQDAARLRAIGGAAPEASLIVDANGAWTHEETLTFSRRAADIAIEWLEQPTPDVPSAVGLRSRLPWPVVADESARGPETIEHLARVFDGVHLKLEKAGTVGRLDATVRAAEAAGLAVHLGQMDQGRLGCAVTTHLAAALGLERAEVWGCAHLEEDLTWDLVNSGGLVAVPAGPGTGVTLVNHHLLKELST